jgi:hypothetical protein
MRLLNGRLAVAAGVVLTVAGILAFSLLAPGATLGEETDVSAPADPPASVPDDTATGPDATGPDAAGPDAAGPDAAPPAALPDTGSGPVTDSNGSMVLLMAAFLSAAGIAMTGAGAVAARQARRARR